MTKNDTNTNTTPVVYARNRMGDLIVHKAGCAHLRNRREYVEVDESAMEVHNRQDVIFDMWGASGVASDDYPGDWNDDGYFAYTIENFTYATEFAPCLRSLPNASDAADAPTTPVETSEDAVLAAAGAAVRNATDARDAAIVAAAAGGMPMRTIADHVGVSTMTVQRIVAKAR